jgi:hypothetical protein
MTKQHMPSKTSPGFGIITPTAYLRRYAAQSHFHLVLAHLIDVDEEYTNFYAQMSDRGDFIIMDNGAFELGESYEPSKLIELGRRVKADAVVLPDYPGQDAERTINAAIRLSQQVKDAGFMTFFAPQSRLGATEEWIAAYRWGAENPDIDIIGMSILGIPNALPHIPRSYARVVMTQLLYDRGVFARDKYHHYLGLNAGPNLELPALIEMQALDSCDSSNPVWAGICGQMYTPMADSFLMTRKIDKHVDFDYPMTSNEYVHSAIQTNIDMTLSLFNR